LIQDSKISHKVRELCFKALVLLGYARSSVEDFLCVCTLLDEQKEPIDIRDELTLLANVVSELTKVSPPKAGEASTTLTMKKLSTSSISLPICSKGQH